MRAKAFFISLAVGLLLLAALSVLSWRAGQEHCQNLLLAIPLTQDGPGVDIERLEKLTDEEFLLTYELRRSATVEAVGQRHSVSMVGTNPYYAGMLGYPLPDGGFFTEAAMDAKSRHVTLNEAAAFQIFGSVRIAGQTLTLNREAWTVTGVIRDGDEENAKLYIPASISGGQANAIMALLDDKVTEAYAKNVLKSIGIHDDSYEFVNLSKSAAAFSERFAVALKTALLAAILLFVLGAVRALPDRIYFYRSRMKELYFSELLRRHRLDFLKTAAGLLLASGGIVTALGLSLQILESCLTWQELITISGELTAGAFGGKIIWLRDWQPIGILLLGIYVGVIVLCLLIAVSHRLHPKVEFRNTQRMVFVRYGKRP